MEINLTRAVMGRQICGRLLIPASASTADPRKRLYRGMRQVPLNV